MVNEKKLIGYTCSYIPVEILAVTGFKPYRLLSGEINLARAGEKILKVDACPLIKSNLSYILENSDKFACIVGSTGCDMARRMFDCLQELSDIPTYIINNPRTDKPEIFYDEIDWLVKELEKLSNKRFEPELINYEIEKWEAVRNLYRQLEAGRRLQTASLLSAAEFAQICANYHRGAIELEIKTTNYFNPPIGGLRKSTKPSVYLIGSPIPYEAHSIIEMLENEVRLVGDFNCGISRFLNIKIQNKDLAGIKQAYYKQIPCIYKRPNHDFYAMVGERLKELACQGIILWTLDYCDNYEFELKRMEKTFGLPVLWLRSDLSFQNKSQLKIRIAAFAEMLRQSI
uniref:2-hydroxyacyl-CoA dehydratase n=1 Tax=candidate division WOR-3 bacterium TaxID=2052148 RepID=A0A7C6ECQ9_UNCW3